MTTQAAIRDLMPELVAMQQRGFTLAQIADALAGGGIKVAVSTLKTYMRRAGDGAKSKLRISAHRDRPFRDRDRRFRDRDRPVRSRDRRGLEGVIGLRMTDPRSHRLPAFCRWHRPRWTYA